MNKNWMTCAFLLGFILLTGLPVSAAAAVSFCDPSPGTSCLTEACKTLGTTKMDGNYKNIIACLSTIENNDDCSTGNCKWITMTTSSYETKEETMTQAKLKTFYPYCINPRASSGSHYTNCSTACSRFCVTGSINGVKNTFVSGFLTGWNNSTGMATCACFH